MTNTLPLKPRGGDPATPRAMLPKGSPDWAYRTLNRLKWALEQKRITEGEYDGILEELDRFQVWNIIPPEKPYGSREAMLKAEVGYTEAEGRKTIVTAETKRGGDRKSETAKSKCNFHFDSQSKRAEENGVSRRTQIKLDKLAAERPDLLGQVMSGDLTATRACKEAGWEITRVSIPLEPIAATEAILKHFNGEALTTLLTELANHAGYDLTPRG